MKLENQVCSLELAKKLKELGFKQESLFYWVKGEMEYGYEGEWDIMNSENYFIFCHTVGDKPSYERFYVDIESSPDDYEDYQKWYNKTVRLQKKRAKEIYSAYTVAELGEMLPTALQKTATWITINRAWNGSKNGKGNWIVSYIPDNGEPNADTYGPITSETIADAIAEMLIYLKENNLI